MDTQVVTVTSKGQISLPVELRRKMSINTGDKFVAYAKGDTIVLKMVNIPSAEECKAIWDEAQKWAEAAGLREEDVNDFIKEFRQRKRNENCN